MKHQERIRALIKIPQLLFDVLFRARYRFVYDQMPVETRGMNLKKRFNLMKSGGNLLYRKLSAWSMPLHMQFELTNY